MMMLIMMMLWGRERSFCCFPSSILLNNAHRYLSFIFFFNIGFQQSCCNNRYQERTKKNEASSSIDAPFFSDNKNDKEEERDLLSRKANSKTKTVSGEEETPRPLSWNSLELTMLLQSRSEFQKELSLSFFFFFLLFLGKKKTMILKEGSSKSSSSNPQDIKQIRVRHLLPWSKVFCLRDVKLSLVCVSGSLCLWIDRTCERELGEDMEMEVEQPNQEQDGDAAEVVFAAESVVAGMEVPLQALRELLLWPVLYAEEARTLGLRVCPSVPVWRSSTLESILL
jgi:hypothetical protein